MRKTTLIRRYSTGDTRIITKFLWFPTFTLRNRCINDVLYYEKDWAWLETVTLEQVREPGCWINTRIIDPKDKLEEL